MEAVFHLLFFPPELWPAFWVGSLSQGQLCWKPCLYLELADAHSWVLAWSFIQAHPSALLLLGVGHCNAVMRPTPHASKSNSWWLPMGEAWPAPGPDRWVQLSKEDSWFLSFFFFFWLSSVFPLLFDLIWNSCHSDLCVCVRVCLSVLCGNAVTVALLKPTVCSPSSWPLVLALFFMVG